MSQIHITSAICAASLFFSASIGSWVNAAEVVLQPGSSFRDCPTCPEMVIVPAGTFIMGSTKEATNRARLREDIAPREWPAHQVRILNRFAAGRYEITVGQYQEFVEATKRPDPYTCITWNGTETLWAEVKGANWHNPGFPQDNTHPVGCLSYQDALDYSSWLSERTGQNYRIPTEAEWEYIARAGTDSLQSWGDTMDTICEYANSSDLSRAEAHGGIEKEPTRFFDCYDGYVYTAPIGTYPPNQFGFHDLVGNVWEWVQDTFIPSYEGAPVDGSARIAPDMDTRLIVRGGGWYSRVWFVRPAGRSREHPAYRSTTLGLRLIRELN